MRFLLILVLVLLIGCGQAREIPLAEAAPSCTEEFLNDTLLRGFGWERESYQVLSGNCTLGRSGKVNITVLRNDTTAHVYWRHGWCSSGGTDCGFDAAVASESKAQVDQVKSVVCQKLAHAAPYAGPLCDNELFDNTSNVISACENGQFDFQEHGLHQFSVLQISHRCEQRVEGGPALS